MKRWSNFVVVLVLLAELILAAAPGTQDEALPGKSGPFSIPFMGVPFGGGPDSKAGKETREGPAEPDEQQKKQQARDKRVDDAIKKAWEDK